MLFFLCFFAVFSGSSSLVAAKYIGSVQLGRTSGRPFGIRLRLWALYSMAWSKVIFCGSVWTCSAGLAGFCLVFAIAAVGAAASTASATISAIFFMVPPDV